MNYRIMIDAGHGGKDTGAVGKTGLKESDVVLNVAKLLHDELLKSPNYYPELTREDDSFQKLSQRVEREKEFQPAIFISLHCNASVSRKPFDTQIYYHKKSSKGKRLARSIFRFLTDIDSTKSKWSRVIENNVYYVLKNTTAPSILIELDFISNPDREGLLSCKLFQKECAKCIAKGIDYYFGKDINDKRILFKHFIR